MPTEYRSLFDTPSVLDEDENQELPSAQPTTVGDEAHSSLFEALGTDPALEARKQELSKQLDTPVALLPSDAEQMAQFNEIDTDKLQQDAPATTKFLADPTNAKLTGVKGVNSLAKMEEAYKTYTPENITKYIQKHRELPGTGNSPAELSQKLTAMKAEGVNLADELDPYQRETKDVPLDVLKSAASGVNVAIKGLSDTSRQASIIQRLVGAVYRPYGRLMDEDFKATQEALGEGQAYWQESKSPAIQKLNEEFEKAGIVDSVGMLVKHPQLTADMLAQSAVYLVPGPGVARLGPEGVAGYNMLIEMGDSANSAREEAIAAGRPEGEQDQVASVAALVTGPLVFLGNKLTGASKLEQRFFSTGTIGESLVNAVVKEGISGAVEEGSNQLGVNVAASNYDDERKYLEGVGKAAVIGGILESTHAVGMSTTERALRVFVKDVDKVIQDRNTGEHEAAKAIVAASTLKDLGTMVDESGLRTNSSEAFNQFVETMVEEGNLTEVYVDSTTMAGVIESNPALRTSAPDLVSRAVQAVELGNDLQITVAEYLTHFSGTPLEETLLNMVKVEPNGPTYTEAQEYYNKQAELFQEEIQAVSEANAEVLSRAEFNAQKASEAEEVAQTTSEQQPLPESEQTTQEAPTQEADATTAPAVEQKAKLPATYEEYLQNHSNQREVYARDIDSVSTKLYEQFKQANRFTSPVNRAYVAPLLDFYVTMAQRAKIMPSELFARYPLNIQSLVDLTGGKVLSQHRNASLTDFKAENVENIVNLDNWVIMTAENPGNEYTPEQNPERMAQFIAQLEAEGIQYYKVDGKYSRDEKSVILFNTTAERALALGRQWNQESVLTKDGFVYQDGSRHVSTGEVDVHKTAPKDFYTTVTFPDGNTSMFTVGINFDQLVPMGDMSPVNPETVGVLTEVRSEVGNLKGLPESSVGRDVDVQNAAVKYMQEAGLPYSPATEYVSVLPERGARIADAYENMEDNPNDPEVRAAYEALVKETLAQYQALKELGYTFDLIPEGAPDPYAGGPREALLDMKNNKHLWVFPTTSGYGQGESQAAGSPMLALTDEYLNGKQLLANDVFRIVHDVFGHAKDGVGFGPRGEENAWQSHVRMFSPLAARAMTTETRGQNSWVNYGPLGEQNRANQKETVYAEQKVGLLPEWVTTEGLSLSDTPAGQMAPINPETVGAKDPTQTEAFKKWFGDSKVVDAEGKPLVVYHGTDADFNTFNKNSFFSPSKDFAEEYGEVKPFYLSIKKPFDSQYYDHLKILFNRVGSITDNYDGEVFNSADDFVESDAYNSDTWEIFEPYKKQIKSLGYDGMVISEGGQRNYLAFEPSQIKSATGNNGTFDSNNPNSLNQSGKVGEVTITGVHYSPELRDTLDGTKYGTGAKGAERDRVLNASDDRIKNRVHFYVDEGNGVFPEFGVGSVAHTVNLTNMYDAARNPLKFPTKDTNDPYNADGFNVFESAVLDAGFDGYYVEKGFGRQGVAVLLGESSKNVKVPQTADVYQSTYYSALTRAVSGVKQGKGSAAQWKGIIKNMPGVKAEEIEAVGINEWLDLQTGSVTKEAIINYLDANGVQVEEVVLGAGDDRLQIVYNDDEEFDVIDTSRPVDDDGRGWVVFTGVRHQDAIDYIKEKTDYFKTATKYESYVVRGDDAGTNYREILLTLPDTKQDARKKRLAEIADEMVDTTQERYAELFEERKNLAANFTESQYKSSHFDQQNILAHVRVDERVGPNGERVLFVNEIQSDWAQEGKKKGFDDEVKPLTEAERKELREVLDYNGLDVNTLTPEQIQRREELILRSNRQHPTQAVPRAPFVQKTDAWVSLAIKRILRYAADQGMDKVAIINGQQAADLYDLSKQVNSVDVTRGEQFNTYDIEVESIEGNRVNLPKTRGLTPEEVTNIVGKDVAEKAIKKADEYHKAYNKYREVLNTPGSTEAELDILLAEAKRLEEPLTGLDLKVGGEGMRVFYDQIVPKVARDVLKKLGAGPLVPGFYAEGTPRTITANEELRVFNAQETVKEALKGLDQANYLAYDNLEEVNILLKKIENTRTGEYTNRNIGNLAPEELSAKLDLAEKKVREELIPAVMEVMDAKAVLRKALEQPEYTESANLSVTLTPELKAKVQSGLPLFQGTRGSFNLDTLTMTLLQGADFSTVIHESGHFYLKMLETLASNVDAPQDIKDDFQKVLEWFELTESDWRAMSLDQQRPYHEQWAESFELWNLEGKAPSQKLQPVFSRFRAWLLDVYRSIEDFLKRNPSAGKLNDEVRGVFSRMLASQEAISAAEQARAYQPLFPDAAAAGMSEADFQRYLSLGQEATDDANRELQTRSMRDMRWLTNARNRAISELQATARETRKTTMNEVAAEVAREPVYQAMRFLRSGETIDPNSGEVIKALQGYKLDKAILAEMYPDTALGNPDLTKLRGLTGADGLHPDLVAQMFGLPSGDALVRELASAEKMSDKIAGLTDQRMLEEHGDLTDNQAIQRAADEAVHNEARARFMATGLKALSKTPISVTQMVKAAKQAAESVIANKRVRDIHPKQFLAAETRANKKVMSTVAKSPLEAADAQRVALLNNRLASSAQDALTEVEKALRYLSKFNNEGTRKNLDIDYIEQIDALLEPFDLRKGASLKTIDARTSLAEWLNTQETELMFEPTIDPVAVAEAKQKSYKNMTMTEVRTLVDTVKQIEHLGRMKKKLLTAIERENYLERINEAITSIEENANRVVEEKGTPSDAIGYVGQWLRQMAAAHRKFSSYMRELDGGKNNGAMFNLLVRPMLNAGNTETDMKAKAAEEITRLFKPIQDKISTLGNLYNRRRVVPNTSISMTNEERIMFAMNWGNEGNRQRLLDGGLTGKKALSNAEARAIIDTLTKEEWDFVQGTLDFIATYKPLIAEQERQLTGKTPEWVEASPIETKFGTYPGGYFPAKYDTVLSTRSDSLEAASDLRGAMKGAFGAAATRNGYTKARADAVKGRPLLLNFNVISRHTAEVVHRLAWQAWVIDANRVLRSLDSPLRTHLGAEATKEIRDTVVAIATGDSPSSTPLEVIANRVRNGTSIVGMGWSFATAFIQPIGITNSIARVGVRHMAKGIASFIANPVAASNWANENSVGMRNRGRTLNREINDILNVVRGGKGVGTITASYFYLIGKMQRMVDVPTYIGAYERSLEEQQYELASSPEERARIEQTAHDVAGQTVIDTQSGGEMKDLAKVQRGGPLFKLFTNFYSYMSMVYNMNVEAFRTTNFKSPSEFGVFVADMILLNFVPVVLSVVLRNALRTDCEWGDTECLVKAYKSEQITHLFGQMVPLREIGAGVSAAVGGDSYGYTGPAGLRFFGDLYKVGVQLDQGEADMALFKALNNAGGTLFHYPAAQVNRTVEGIIAIENGEAEGLAILPMLMGGPPK